jgi:hypothetical protein
LNIFFDVDYTIQGVDGSLRPGTSDVFDRLVRDGHTLYIWSGVGDRSADVKRHQLQSYVSGVFEKPINNFETGLARFNVTVKPDFVIDDYPEIVGVFGGTMIRPYYFPSASDGEMERVYEVIDEYARTGASSDSMFRQPNGGHTA